MNRVILMGRLTRDPDIRYSGSGEDSMCIARFTLAVDRRRSSQDGQNQADFIGCVAFRKTAEFAEKYLHQGTKIAVTGSIQTGSYVNKDNQKVYTTDVIVDDIEFAESKAASDLSRQGGYQGNNGYQRPQQQSWQQSRPEPAGAGFGAAAEESAVGQGFLNIPEGVEDEGLPFN